MVYSDWAFEVTLHSSSARLDGIYPVQIHLIGIRNSPDHYSVRNKEVTVSLYEFTLWGQDLVSVVRIRERLYYRGSFLKKVRENFGGTLETVRNNYRGVCIREAPYRDSTVV